MRKEKKLKRKIKRLKKKIFLKKKISEDFKKLKKKNQEIKSFIIKYHIKNKKNKKELEKKAENQNILNQKLFAQSLEIDQRNFEVEEYAHELKSKNEKLKESNEIILENEKEIKKQYNKLILQKEIIYENHKSIKDSINYAKKIQNAILTSKTFIDEMFDNFILFLPKQTVSGDFYIFRKIGKYKIFTIADCTGHGVPGAFITILGINFINSILDEKNLKKPSEILEILRENFKKLFKFSEQKDGMDIVFCIFNTETNILEFSGANNPLILIRDEQLIEYKTVKNPIGFYYKEKKFINYKIEIKKNDKIYLYSDGFQDQFGGKKNSKFQSKRFKNLLLDTHKLDMQSQKNKLKEIFFNWKGKTQQIDDILIAGINF
ncbi:MAG: hypothetical protein B6I24_03185 [Bacteroidetes bacterium 4572_128]|nr:MAG: hypothetical protein B6I24_03185 [Bacteroidetes bacterium 4572_128]